MCGAAVLFSLSIGQVIAEEPARPDILLIMPDQMRGDCLSTVGHPAVRTPTLDRLARRGMLFRRAYSTVPSCIPARYALLTGLYPQTSGVVGFRQKEITSPTMPQLLRDAGYATALVGREMHQSVGAAKLGYQTEIRGSTYVSNDDYTADLKKAVPDMGEIRAWVGRLGTDLQPLAGPTLAADKRSAPHDLGGRQSPERCRHRGGRPAVVPDRFVLRTSPAAVSPGRVF